MTPSLPRTTAALLCSALLLVSCGETPSAPPAGDVANATPTAAAASAPASVCDRACLADIAEQYLKALVARQAAALPLAADVRYTENGQELALTDGLWATASEAGAYRQLFADSAGDQLGLFATLRENGHPVLIATRIELAAGRIREIETIVTRPTTATAPGIERLERENNRFWWDEPVAPVERLTREALVKAADKYFVALEKNDGRGEYPFTADCYRYENGNLATGNPEMRRLAEEAERRRGPPVAGQPGAIGYRLMSLPCREQFQLGYMRMVDRIRDRRFPVVDVERGVVFTLVFFDHSGTVHEVTTTDGKTHQVNLRQPFTWEIAEAFKIDKGNIRAIEAVLTQAPYGMKPNWPE